MILVVSTSSPVASAALVRPGGEVVLAAEADADHRAGERVLTLVERLLAEAGVRWSDLEAAVADVGPGGFTGTRVGVAVAKTFAWTEGRRAGAVSAFDLVDPHAEVALPVRRGCWRVRPAGADPGQAVECARWPEGARGYGSPAAHDLPSAAAVGPAWDRIRWVEPADLLPDYGAEPSISVPKRPYGLGAAAGVGG